MGKAPVAARGGARRYCRATAAPHISPMLDLRLTVLAAALLASLGACAAPQFTAEVTRFHTLPAAAEGGSFMVAPTEKARSGSLEFASYAERIVAQLQARGYRQASSLERSDFLVLVDYAVDTGRPESRVEPVYGYYPDRFAHVRGVRRDGRSFSADVYESGGFVPIGTSQVVETVYSRNLMVEIVDAAQWRQGKTVKRFEGEVVSVGPESSLPLVMPAMIRALFEEFPGESGASRRYSSRLDQG